MKRLILFFLVGIFLDVNGPLYAAHAEFSHGAIIRGDTTVPEIALIFTGGDYSDGGAEILHTLAEKQVQADDW